MKKIFLTLTLFVSSICGFAAESFKSNIVAQEGAWCWFADPRALHYENAAGTINASYLGYIDVHGNVKATQYDWLTGRKTDVLIRSYFQPDDHNNPTFVVLPDERVMIFYTRHTDEAKIWYRISRKPGDITALGDEKYLATANNTTYPSPFILSDDPNHIYLCWRGIGWHPTIARITMPDNDDNCQFDFGPKQIVQSTGARPYAKYQSNGKDKIYLSYTTGHPDNEMPDWLYLNVIDINNGNGPILRDLAGTQLSIINNGVFNVSKTDSYASSYPKTIVDKSSNIRNWVWQIALDKDENPVIAYPHIDDAKTSHVYWYARWNGSEWRRTWVQYAGHAFHQNWNKTERCYSGGMTLDPDNINDMYLSIPTKDGQYNKDGVYEIWRYTIDDEGNVAGSEQITKDSPKNNVRPFILPGSKNSKLRLSWMQGDYYYWMVNKNYPQGYPTSVLCNYEWTEEVRDIQSAAMDCICLSTNKTLHSIFTMNEAKYEGTLLSASEANTFTYGLGSDNYPFITINGKTYKSQNRLLTSDNWALNSTGTSGDNHPTKLETWQLTLTYDGHTLTAYRNGLVDQVIEIEGLDINIMCRGEGFNHECLMCETMGGCATPLEVQAIAKQALLDIENARWQTLPTTLQNGDFEGNYSVQQGSGVSSDRAIYMPEGWTVTRTTPNENDLTGLKSGDLYFDQFFGPLAHPDSHGQKTYWIRQNWGTPTLTLSQELRLPEGEYTLTCDVWKSGLGGDAYMKVQTWGETAITAPTIENKEAWQQFTLTFESDGNLPTTISLQAMHNNNGTAKIIGFDNLTLTRNNADGIGKFENEKMRYSENEGVYDLSGRRLSAPSVSSVSSVLPKGVYISNGKKHLR